MDLKELNYVVTVANEGSISRAVEKLFMSQSSLSQAIRVLEQDLGTSVFVRTTRGVRPTAAGDAFFSHAKQILQQYRAACSEAADIENLNGGTVIFGISTYRGTYLLPPVLKRFRALYPKVHVEICEMDSKEFDIYPLRRWYLADWYTHGVAFQHNTRVNVLMLDAHVRTYGYTELRNLPTARELSGQ